MGTICKNKQQNQYMNELTVVQAPVATPSTIYADRTTYHSTNQQLRPSQIVKIQAQPMNYSKYKPKIDAYNPGTSPYVYPVNDVHKGKKQRLHDFMSRHKPHLHRHHHDKNKGNNTYEVENVRTVTTTSVPVQQGIVY